MKLTLDVDMKEIEYECCQANQQENTDNQETPAPPVSCKTKPHL